MKKYFMMFCMVALLMLNTSTTQAWEGSYSVIPEFADEYADKHYNMYGSDCVYLLDGKDNKTGNRFFVIDTDKTYSMVVPNNNGFVKFTTIAYDRTGHYPQDKPLLIELWVATAQKVYVRISENTSIVDKYVDVSPYNLPNVHNGLEYDEFFPRQTIVNLFQVMTNYGVFPSE